MQVVRFTIVVVLFAACAESAEAQLVRKIGQFFGSQLIRETSEEAVEQSVKQGVRAAAKEAVEVSAKAGAGNAAGRSLITSGAGQGTGIAAKYGDEALEAFSKVTPQNARRLQMLTDELVSTGRADEVWSIIAKGGRGDQVVDFLWRNKGTLVGSAVVATFIADPDGFLHATSKAVGNVTESVGTTIVEPVVRETGRTAVNWLGATILLISIGLVASLACYHWHRRSGALSISSNA